jgi:transposase
MQRSPATKVSAGMDIYRCLQMDIMKKIWIAAAAVIATATLAIIYLRSKETRTEKNEEDKVIRAKMQKHRTQVFSKAKELSRQSEEAI